MDKKPLIVVSLCAVVLLVMGSLSNVVGYQSVQTSQQNTIKERINQRELLFQTIVDIMNNKEIQRILLKSQMSRGIFLTSEIPVVTKNQIRQIYFLGLILSKVISKSRIQSMIGMYQFNNQEIQKEISSVIEKDTTINSEITQLKDAECDCENENKINWTFPVLCSILFFIFLPQLLLACSLFLSGLMMSLYLYRLLQNEDLAYLFFVIMLELSQLVLLVPLYIGHNLNCWWMASD
jgi:hypothetical protein